MATILGPSGLPGSLDAQFEYNSTGFEAGVIQRSSNLGDRVSVCIQNEDSCFPVVFAAPIGPASVAHRIISG